MKQKRGLGRGLSALIPDSIENIDSLNDTSNSVLEIDINEIKPKKDQPRREFNKDALKELETSIGIHGVVQPIIVRKIDKGYEIIAGERRWRACKNINAKNIPCIVKELDDRKVMEISLIENIQREDLNEIEEGEAFKKLIEEFGITQEELGNILGKSRTYITNIMRILKLPKEVKQMIVDERISGGHGRTLLRIKDEGKLIDTANKIILEKLSVRQTEKLVAEIVEDIEKGKSKRKTSRIRKDPTILYLENTLKDKFSTKVNILKGKKKSKIEIEYYSDEDLQRILDIIGS